MSIEYRRSLARASIPIIIDFLQCTVPRIRVEHASINGKLRRGVSLYLLFYVDAHIVFVLLNTAEYRNEALPANAVK